MYGRKVRFADLILPALPTRADPSLSHLPPRRNSTRRTGGFSLELSWSGDADSDLDHRGARSRTEVRPAPTTPSPEQRRSLAPSARVTSALGERTQSASLRSARESYGRGECRRPIRVPPPPPPSITVARASMPPLLPSRRGLNGEGYRSSSAPPNKEHRTAPVVPHAARSEARRWVAPSVPARSYPAVVVVVDDDAKTEPYPKTRGPIAVRPASDRVQAPPVASAPPGARTPVQTARGPENLLSTITIALTITILVNLGWLASLRSQAAVVTSPPPAAWTTRPPPGVPVVEQLAPTPAEPSLSRALPAATVVGRASASAARPSARSSRSPRSGARDLPRSSR